MNRRHARTSLPQRYYNLPVVLRFRLRGTAAGRCACSSSTSDFRRGSRWNHNRRNRAPRRAEVHDLGLPWREDVVQRFDHGCRLRVESAGKCFSWPGIGVTNE